MSIGVSICESIVAVQAARGCNKELELNVTDACPRCKGEKAEPGTRKVRCHFCNGTGMVLPPASLHFLSYLVFVQNFYVAK